MAKTEIQTEDAPKSFAGYSEAIKSNVLVFVSGQGPFDTKIGDWSARQSVWRRILVAIEELTRERR